MFTMSSSGFTTASSAEPDVSDIKKYVKLGKLGEAFSAGQDVILLIDEIDKAGYRISKRPALGA